MADMSRSWNVKGGERKIQEPSLLKKSGALRGKRQKAVVWSHAFPKLRLDLSVEGGGAVDAP